MVWQLSTKVEKALYQNPSSSALKIIFLLFVSNSTLWASIAAELCRDKAKGKVRMLLEWADELILPNVGWSGWLVSIFSFWY